MLFLREIDSILARINLELIEELPEGQRELGLLRVILGFERTARNSF